MKDLLDLKKEIVMFLNTHMGIKLPEQKINNYSGLYNYDNIEIEINEPDPNFKNCYEIITLEWKLLIEKDSIKMFTETLEEYSSDKLDKLSNAIANRRDSSIKFIPHVSIKDNDFDPFLYDDGAMGINFTRIDDRFEKLRNFIHTEFQHIAQHMTDGAAKFNADDTKAKTEDLFIQFNTKEPGDKVEFFMTLSRVPAIFDPTKPIDPSMVPMTDEERFELFDYPTRQKEKAEAGITIGDEISASMDRVNKRIQDFIHNIDTENFPSCMEYTINMVNGILIPMIVTLQLEPYGFFGGTSKSLFDPEILNVNSDECCTIIDQAVTELFTHLDSIPVPEGSGIDHYAIDHDSFGIYGRDANQRVVRAMVDPKYMFSTVLEPKFSTGFTEVFKRFLKTKKNKYVFSQIGKIDEESIKSPTDVTLTELNEEKGEQMKEETETLSIKVLQTPTAFPNAPHVSMEIILKLDRISKLINDWKEFGFDKDMLKAVLDDTELKQYENGEFSINTALEKLACHELSIDRDELVNEIKTIIPKEKSITIDLEEESDPMELINQVRESYFDNNPILSAIINSKLID